MTCFYWSDDVLKFKNIFISFLFSPPKEGNLIICANLLVMAI